LLLGYLIKQLLLLYLFGYSIKQQLLWRNLVYYWEYSVYFKMTRGLLRYEVRVRPIHYSIQQHIQTHSHTHTRAYTYTHTFTHTLYHIPPSPHPPLHLPGGAVPQYQASVRQQTIAHRCQQDRSGLVLSSQVDRAWTVASSLVPTR
jgi:hypothetical protein